MQDGNSFPILPGQHITTGAELDKRPYHTTDERCYQGMGPIPVDCRSGSCGTCWVGILEGKDQTDPVSDFEQKRMQYFGYWENPFHDPAAERPLIRLACQTIVRGSCRIIIPTWNGVLGSARQSRRLER
jgi:ferredoxin